MKVIILLCSLFLALQANIGKITTIQGEVKILRDSKSLQGKPSFVLENKDVVNTGNNSRTQLLFNDETLISLGENSTFSIEEYLVDDTKPNDSEMSLEISKGILKAITGKIGKINPNKFKLKTRSATIGIRGTIFFVQIMEDGSEYLVCKKGAIIVESPQGITYIPEGFYVLIQTDGNVGVPQPFTEQELKRIENETGNIESKEYVTVDDEKYTPIIKTDTPPTNGPEGGVPKYSYQGASEEFINHMNKGAEEVTEEGNKPVVIVLAPNIDQITENTAYDGMVIATFDSDEDSSNLTLSDNINYKIVGNEIQLTQAGADLVNDGNTLPPFSIYAKEATSNTITLPTITVDDPATIVVTTTVQNLTEDSISAGVTIATIDAHDEDSDLILTLSDTQNYVIVGNAVQLTQAGADIVNSGNDLPSFSVDANGVTSNMITISTIQVDDPAIITISPLSEEITENNVFAGMVVATIDAYDEDDDITVSISDTVNYTLVEYSEQATQQGKILRAGGKRLIQVQLTQAGADYVNAGNDLPPFTVSVNGVTSDEFTLPATVEVNDPPTIVLTPILTQITQRSATAGTVIATIDAYDEEGDTIVLTLSDTVNYIIVDNEVQLTQAGADLINEGDTLPPFTVTANGIISNEIALTTILFNSPATIVLTSTLTQIVEGSATAGTVVATIDAHDEDDALIYTLSDTVNYVIVGNQVQLTQAGADLVNSGADLPNFTVDANGVTSNEIDPVNTTPAPTVNPAPQTSTKTATFNVLSSARREPETGANNIDFIGSNSIYKTMANQADTVSINNGTLNGSFTLNDFDKKESPSDYDGDSDTTTIITMPQPTLPEQTTNYSSFSSKTIDSNTTLFYDDMQEFFILENSFLESVSDPDDYKYIETTIFGTKPSDLSGLSGLDLPPILKYKLPNATENSFSEYGTDTHTYINRNNFMGTSYTMDDNKISIEILQLNSASNTINGRQYATTFDYDEYIEGENFSGALFGSKYQGIGTLNKVSDNHEDGGGYSDPYSIVYTTGKYRDINYFQSPQTTSTSTFRGLTYENGTKEIELTIDSSTGITGKIGTDLTNGLYSISLGGDFSDYDSAYIHDDLFSILNITGTTSGNTINKGWLIALNSGSLSSDGSLVNDGSDDHISWGYWGADAGDIVYNIEREAWVATNLTKDDISSWGDLGDTTHNKTYIGPMMGIVTESGTDNFIDPATSKLTLTFDFVNDFTTTSVQINGTAFDISDSPVTILDQNTNNYTARDSSSRNQIIGEFYNSGDISIGRFDLKEKTTNNPAKGVFKIKKQP